MYVGINIKTMKSTRPPQKHKRTLLWPAALILLVLAGSGLYAWQHHISKTHRAATGSSATTTSSEPDIKVPTHSATTEGQTIQVPDNVAPGSIKDYALITENDQYKIRELNGAYTITLYAIINNPSEADSYHQQLHDYKQAALQYLTQHGVNVNKVSITYDPPEAAQY